MSYAHLPILLRRTGWLTLTLEVVRAFAARSASFGCRLAALAIDAVLGLYASALIAVDVLLFGLLLGGGGLRRRHGGATGSIRAASPVKSSRDLGLLDSRLINSVDFLDGSSESSVPAVRQSVQAGRRVGRPTFVGEAADLRPPWKRPPRPSPPSPCSCSQLSGARCASSRWSCHGTSIRPATILPSACSPSRSRSSSVRPIRGSRPRLRPPWTDPTGPIAQTWSLSTAKSGTPFPCFGRKANFVLPIERAEKTRDFYIETPKGRSDRYRFRCWLFPLSRRPRSDINFPSTLAGPRRTRT